MRHHGYSLTEIEQLLPWEREVYIQMIIQDLKKEKEKARNTKPL